jgi:hypothetical protein
MYKRLLNAHGTTTSLLSVGGNAVAVNAGLYTAIAAVLGSGDWSYLRLQDSVNTEIVKVFAILGSNTIAINRAKDGTKAYTFGSGSTVDYVDTVSGVLDSITVNPLTLTALGAIDIIGGVVDYPLLDIETLGGAEVNGQNIGEVTIAAGCCELIGEGTPPIPVRLTRFRVTDADDYRVTSEDDYRISV